MNDKEKFLLAMRTINRIEDYFEYMNESRKDKRVVMMIIDEFVKELSKDNEQK